MPKTRINRVALDLYFIGFLTMFAQFLIPEDHNHDVQHTLLSAIGIGLTIPLFVTSIIGIVKSLRRIREQRRILKRLEIELIVHETILKIFDPEGYKKAMSKTQMMQHTAELFNRGKKK